jgi:murein L,D-transpeptidase YafK
MDLPSRRAAIFAAGGLWFASGGTTSATSVNGLPQTPRSRDAIARNEGRLTGVLASLRLRLGAPVYLRVTKEPERIDVFLEGAGGNFQRFRSYDVCALSGQIGPKLRAGDLQVPEGFYAITREGLRPGSTSHLGLDIGYPNLADRQLRRSGGGVAIHGGCKSNSSLAITDPAIEEIYTLVDAAMRAGQAAVPVHIFPFPLTSGRLRRERENKNYALWANLQLGWDLFEKTKRPPRAKAQGGRYQISAG